MQEEMQWQEQQQQQILCGDDNKKCKGNDNSKSNGKRKNNSKSNGNSRSPAGMTTRNATATAGVVKYAGSCECWRRGNPLQFGFGLRLRKYGDMDESSEVGAACVFGDESRSVCGGECE
jgi:hypothetical protein